MRRERLANLTTEQKRKFLPFCPDFVVELRSPSDPLATVQAKMREYIENGAPGVAARPRVEAGLRLPTRGAPTGLENPHKLSGEPELPGFVLDRRPTSEPGF